jgi:hypothetical protein
VRAESGVVVRFFDAALVERLAAGFGLEAVVTFEEVACLSSCGESRRAGAEVVTSPSHESVGTPPARRGRRGSAGLLARKRQRARASPVDEGPGPWRR